MGIGNLGFGELMIILVIVLVLFGARRVPEIGASIGRGIREFKKNINDATREVTSETSVDQNRLTSADIERQRTVDETERTPKRLI